MDSGSSTKDSKSKDLRNDPGVEVAPLIDEFVGNKETFKKLQET